MKKVVSVEDVNNLNIVIPGGEKVDEQMPTIPADTTCTIIEEADFMDRKFYRFLEYDHKEGKIKWWYPSEMFKDKE